MFEDVAQMEKEIETFRKNITDSSKLIESISQLVDITKQQKKALDSVTENLDKKIDSCILQIKKDHDAALQELSSSNESAISKLENNMEAQQSRITADFQTRVTELEKIRELMELCCNESVKQSEEKLKQLTTEGERLISEMRTVIGEQQAAYAEKLGQTEASIREYQTDAVQKYKEFIDFLETTNVDRIFVEVQGLKQSVQTKFMILMGGISITFVAAILSIVIK